MEVLAEVRHGLSTLSLSDASPTWVSSSKQFLWSLALGCCCRLWPPCGWVPSCEQQDSSSALLCMLVFQECSDGTTQFIALQSEGAKNFLLVIKRASTADSGDTKLDIHNRVFNKLYRERPFCTISCNSPKVQTQQEKSLFAESQKMFWFSLCVREKKSRESNSVLSLWITLHNTVLIRGGMVNLPVCAMIFLKYVYKQAGQRIRHFSYKDVWKIIIKQKGSTGLCVVVLP